MFDKGLMAIKLLVDDDNHVWYGYANHAPIQTGLSPIEFLLHPVSNEFCHFRLAGIPSNFNLALALYSRVEAVDGTVEICSPAICRTNASRHKPQTMLLAMYACGLPASLGGWQEIGYNEYISLALAVSRQKTQPELLPQAFTLAKEHPAWGALTFIPHIDINACIELLSLIIDPRWFISITHPDRGARLRRFLGLDLTTAKKTLLPKGDVYSKRYICAKTAWRYDKINKLIESPGYFLWRIYEDVLQRSKNELIAEVRTTQTFVEYLRLCWLAAICCGPKQAEPLFIAEHFFRKRYEADAFYNHMIKELGA